MTDVVKRLQVIIDYEKEKPARRRNRAAIALTPVVEKQSKGTRNPWIKGSAVATALETFTSRLEDSETRAKLEKLSSQVAASLGDQAVDIFVGVYNPARLYRYLCNAEMDVADAHAKAVIVANSRTELKMDEKRERIVSELVLWLWREERKKVLYELERFQLTHPSPLQRHEFFHLAASCRAAKVLSFQQGPWKSEGRANHRVHQHGRRCRL